MSFMVTFGQTGVKVGVSRFGATCKKACKYFSVVCLASTIVPIGAAEPTPADQPLAPGEISVIAAASRYSPPQGFSGWPADNLFRYKLYLPADYQTDNETSYPLMFIASPQGDADMNNMAERLTRDRWIVVMLVESRNSSVLWLPSFASAYDDVIERVRVDKNMIFCTGLSGGARVCSSYPGVRPGFRGLILQAAGFMQRPDYLHDAANAHIVVYGTFGSEDFNLREARRLRTLPPHTRRLTEVWQGAHSWAPADVFGRALDWVEAKVFLDNDSGEPSAAGYHWYLVNKLAQYDAADNDIERYHLYRLLQDLTTRRPLPPDDAITARLQAIDAQMQPLLEDETLVREQRAQVALAEALALDVRERGPDLDALIECYGSIADQYPDTVYGRQAVLRQQSLLWESGRGNP
jgi:hypothetical protein